ncbi:MAG: hypothetical protein AAFU85_10345 [Planctomycetota bacterium]
MSQQAKRYAKRDALWQARSLMRTTLSMFPGSVPELLSMPAPDERPWLRSIYVGRGRLDETRIDSEGMQRIRHALRQLRSLPANVYRRLSREPDGWLARVEQLCDQIAARLDGQRVTLDQLARIGSRRMHAQLESMVTDCPELETLLSTVLQIELTRRDGVDETRWKFLRNHVHSMHQLVIAEDDLRLHLGLYQIAPSIHPKWFQFLVEALRCRELSDEACAQLPRFSKRANELRKLLKCGTPIDQLSQPRLRGELITNARWLLHQTPKQVRVYTRLLASLIDDRTIEDVRGVFSGVADATRAVERAHAKATACGPMRYIEFAGGDGTIEQLLKVPEGMAEMTKSLLLLRNQLNAISTCEPDLATLRAMTRFFESMSDVHWRVRLEWLQASELALGKSCQQRTIEQQRLLTGLARLFARRGVPARIRASVSCEDLVTAIQEEAVDREQLSRYLAVVERVLYERPTIAFEGATAAYAAMYASSRAEAIELVETHARRGNSHTNLYHLQFAMRIADGAEQAFDVLRWFFESGLCYETLELLSGIDDPLIRRAIHRMLSSGQMRRLDQLVTHLRLVKAVKIPLTKMPCFDRDTAWVRAYPETLHDALRELSERCEDAPAIAADVLRKNFPRTERLQGQIDFLQQRLKSRDVTAHQRTRMEAKVERLRYYLSHPTVPALQRLQNLEAKLRRRCESWVLEEFEFRSRAESLQSITGGGADQSLPARLSKTPYNELLPAVLSLSGRSRTIGLRLLFVGDRERKNVAPLEPANARFLARMRRLGINMEPWLREKQTVRNRWGEFQLGFEHDALELLLMGHHFLTCLSPHDVNFFSAISNAIDLNKQVLFCRTESGRVVGRCLFALTNEGLVQTFNRYSHDGELPFDDMVDAFAEDLARRMGTGLTSGGSVSNLVSNDWYDDGPIPGGLTRILEGDRPLEKVLSSTKSSTLSAELCEFFGTRASVVANITLILTTIDETKRRDLIVPFIEHFGFDGRLSFAQQMRLAIRAHHQGATDLAQRFLDQQPLPRLLARLRRFVKEPCELSPQMLEQSVIGMLMRADLRLAHRFLISTRPKGVRQDEQETSPLRRSTLAEIHRRRGRTERARRLTQKSV